MIMDTATSEATPMSTTFRVGDRVRHKPAGDCGEFLGVLRDGWVAVRLDDMTPDQHVRVENLEPETPAFKVGDRVRFVDHTFHSGFSGRVEIVPENPDYSWVIRLDEGCLGYARREQLILLPDVPEPAEAHPVAAIAGAAAHWQQCGQDREVMVHLRGHVVKVTAVVLQGEDPYLVKFLGPIAPEAVAEALDLACLRRCNLTVEVSPSGPDSFAAEDDR